MKKLLLILISSLLAISACNPFSSKKDDDNTTLGLVAIAAMGSAVTEIPFTLISGTDPSVPFGCNKTTAGHATSVRHISESLNFRLKDARFYVHDVKLVKADGSTTDFALSNDGTWQNGTVALLDFEDKTGDCTAGTTDTNLSLKGYAAPGNYVGVEFKVGVPEAQNSLYSVTASAPLNVTAMYWSWTTGYKFFKFEWKTTEGAGGLGTFHLGASGTCTGGNGSSTNLSCTYPDIPTVRVTRTNNAAWTPSANPVYLDVKALVQGTNTNVADGGASLTCMGNSNTTALCKPLLTNIGVNQADGKTLSTQTAFYLKP